jgi:hypothetical protein
VVKRVGAVYKPWDAKKRRQIDKALEDLDPSIRDTAKKLIENYHGEDLDKKLGELIGYEKMRKIVEKK